MLLTWATQHFTGVPVKHAPRLAGESNYTIRRLITHAFNLMTGFSTLPLKLASVVGFVFTLFGFVAGVDARPRYLSAAPACPASRSWRRSSLSLRRADVHAGHLRRVLARMYAHDGAGIVGQRALQARPDQSAPAIAG